MWLDWCWFSMLPERDAEEDDSVFRIAEDETEDVEGL